MDVVEKGTYRELMTHLIHYATKAYCRVTEHHLWPHPGELEWDRFITGAGDGHSRKTPIA